jgi:hypothetical protein
MSKRKDRERAQRGLIFRGGKIVNVNEAPNTMTPAEIWAMRKASEEEERVKILQTTPISTPQQILAMRKTLVGRKGIVLLRPPKKVSEEEVKNGTA